MLNSVFHEFKRPPLVEVICGVQISGIEEWSTLDYGRFWQVVQHQYSEHQDHAPLPPLRLDQSAVPGPQVVSMPPLRRVFYLEPPGNFLIQLQPNRLIHNWRKQSDGDEYPRFERAYERFVMAWRALEGYLSDAHRPGAHPEVFELSYVNHIHDQGAKFPQDAWKYLAFYGQTPTTLGAASTAMSMQFTWPLPNDTGTLSLDLKHGLRDPDGGDVLVIELNARGKARGESLSGMNDWFQTAHKVTVQTFVDFTTEYAHDLWGRCPR